MKIHSLCLLLIALGITGTFAPLSAHDEEIGSRRVVAVSGEETVRIPATRARLTAMIETQAESPAAVQEIVRERSQSLLVFLQRAGVEHLQAGAMSLHPIYGEPERSSQPARPPGGPQVIAYRAQWSASFEVAAARAGEIADGVVRAGAARLADFSFTATEIELADAQQRALRNAALKARHDAAAVLDALGYVARDVVRVEINSGGPVRPMMQRGMEMAAFSSGQDAPSTAVEPGLIEVHASVRIEVAY